METLPMCLSKPNGYVYIARMDSSRFDNWYKIGVAKDINGRMKTYQGRYGSITLIAYGYTHNRKGVEKRMHSLLNNDRPPHSCGWGIEFFKLDNEKLDNAIFALKLFCQTSLVYN